VACFFWFAEYHWSTGRVRILVTRQPGRAARRRNFFVISKLRDSFNRRYQPAAYAALLAELETRCGMKVEFRVAETPIFVPLALLDEMAGAGIELAQSLLANPQCLAAARSAIPRGYCAAGETAHPHFLTADFALVRDSAGNLVPRLVELQAFPSVYGYQAIFCSAYRDTYALDPTLRVFLGGLGEADYWELLRKTIVAGHDPENVILTEIDPQHQKTRPDFEITARRLGIAVVDIRTLEAAGNKLHYRNASGRLTPVHRIYNRAIADELIARDVRLPFDWTRPWDVEWAGHPNWYFLISKFSIPWLSDTQLARESEHPGIVPPAVFLSDFLAGPGRQELARAGVAFPADSNPDAVLSGVLLKPLFSFAGKGIVFDPTQAQLKAIPPARRGDFLLQQRMHFEPTIDTPFGLTQAEIRILYLWPDGGRLTPALSLVRLGRGQMMGVDHNRGSQFVGASAAFYPAP
jgi:hypothetical protein